jgi:hypothetical protein
MMKSSVAFTLAAVLSGAAFAQSQPQAQPDTYTPPPASTAAQQAPPSATAAPDLEAIFNKLNTSHTGKLTKAEAQAHPTVAANFDAADANHDGVVTKDEFMAAFKPAQ